MIKDGMSKKTKKQKIIASYRNKLRLLESQKRDYELKQEIKEEKEEEKEEKQNLPKKEKDKIIKDIQKDNTYSNYFKTDFKKSLIITILILGFEIGLYTAAINNFVPFLK